MRMAILVLSVAALAGAQERQVSLSLAPEKVLNGIGENIYGQFYEHIYHSANGGLWGDLIWNRSFEELPPDTGRWEKDAGMIRQTGHGVNARLIFGDPGWTDYEYTLEARKRGGQEGFLILFRVTDEENFYWYNLGGWGNTRHAIEKGIAGEGRWKQIAPGVAGKIEKGRWYRIRVRCEGPRFRIWLDSEKVLDFTDPDRPHPAGSAGIGAWATQNDFRNIRVESLDGEVLYEGRPDVPDNAENIRFWDVSGSGRVRRVNVNPLNSSFCLGLSGDAGETVLRHAPPLCLRKDVRYEGSLWIRDRVGNMKIRIRDGEAVLAEIPVRCRGPEWEAVEFAFTAPRDTEAGIFEIVYTGNASCYIDQVSLMPQPALEKGGFRPDLLQAIADLRPPLIRWPGGCFAEHYRWKDGIGPQHERGVYPISIWDDQDVNSLGTDEFIDLCRRTGAEPLIVVNIGSHADVCERQSYIAEACDWIEYCNGPADSEWGAVRARNGHPEPYNVKYWEVDNETWFMGAEGYIDAVRAFVPAMKKADPGIKIAVCGSGGMNRDWNQKILGGCAELMDYLSIHHYENPDLFAEGPYNYEKFFRNTAEQIAASANPGITIYVSEWNAQSTDWRTGLYCGGLLNAFERCGDFIEIGGPALFLRHVSATDWDNAFINFDQCGWFPAPNYVIMKLWRDHYAPHRSAAEGDTGGLNIVANKTADSRVVYIKAVNPFPEPRKVRIRMESFRPAAASMQLVAPGSLDARNTIAAPENVRPEPAEVICDGQYVVFRLPGFSAGVAVIKQ
jgi:alpha-L-arabinofuranosidase